MQVGDSRQISVFLSTVRPSFGPTFGLADEVVPTMMKGGHDMAQTCEQCKSKSFKGYLGLFAYLSEMHFSLDGVVMIEKSKFNHCFTWEDQNANHSPFHGLWFL